MLGRCGENMTKTIRLKAFCNLLRQDVAFFDDERHGTGKLCTRLASDAPNIRYVSEYMFELCKLFRYLPDYPLLYQQS